jgi:hypothetical protein
MLCMSNRESFRFVLVFLVLLVLSNSGLTALENASLRSSSAPDALTVTSLTADRAFPVSIEWSVTWTALVTGGASPYTYKFLVFDGSAWTVGRDWNASNMWTWYPQIPGDYIIQVWVRNAGSSNPFDAWFGQSATINLPTSYGPTVTSVTASPRR